MNRAYYSDTVDGFLAADADGVIGALAVGHKFTLDPAQTDAWRAQVDTLRRVLADHRGCGATVGFEYAIPRLGKRIDVVLVLGPVVFVLEFKVGERTFAAHAIDQVWDYALDLKNFHESSHAAAIAPILIATAAKAPTDAEIAGAPDGLLHPVRASAETLGDAIRAVLAYVAAPPIDPAAWSAGRYCPTPTIIEAATALYGGHAVTEISRSDASA
ncbi:MAG TPA: hypothetical protein VEA69_21320, partial [Tepidisphaeraceae bacterium]|nr:hypothetical protein [Tepidisphaeraceae bacterium]